MNLAHYLGLLLEAEQTLATAFREVAAAHGDEPDIVQECRRMARQCGRHADLLRPFTGKYGAEADDEPDRLHSDLFGGTRAGSLALLRDLHDLYLMVCETDIAWTVVAQGAAALRDRDLQGCVSACDQETVVQRLWLTTRIKQSAPQTLVAS